MVDTVVDTSLFRHVMGRFATGVTVVTSRHGDQLHGMTANAITSVSLEPMTVLVCVDHTAEMHDILVLGRVFTISILRAEQEEVSRTFARKREPSEECMRGVPYRLGNNGCPIIEGCLAYLECRLVAQYPGGDHTIFLGEVEELAICSDSEPLIFYKSDYTSLRLLGAS